jgi:hypothetical protein
MIRFRTWILGPGFAMALAAVALAAPPDKAKQQGKAKGGIPAALEQFTKLLPADAEDKLKLTDDQKQKVGKIQDEFGDKSKGALAAVKDAFASNREAIKKARQDKDRAALKTAMTPLREKLQDYMKVRADYEAKVQDLLNEDQKKTLDELKADQQGKGPLANLLGKARAKKKADPAEPKKTDTTEPKKDEPKKDK